MTTNRNILEIPDSYRSDRPDNYPPPSAFFKAIYPISDAAAAFIDEHSFYSTIPRGTHVLKPGMVCPYLFMMHKGVMRGYIKDNNKEVCTWITAENYLVTSISSFFSQLPALEHIQALEECDVTCFKYEHVEYMYAHFPEMNILARKVLEQYYYDAEQRSYIIRLSKASLKYEYFLRTKSYLVNRIPLKYIASYLGMTLETLSRERGNISRGNR